MVLLGRLMNGNPTTALVGAVLAERICASPCAGAEDSREEDGFQADHKQVYCWAAIQSGGARIGCFVRPANSKKLREGYDPRATEI